MTAKTATSILLEFCTQEKVAPPQYEPVIHGSNPSEFVMLVKAFNLIAKGSGRTKKEAKHAASQQLIEGLSRTDKYKNKLNIDPLPPPPPPPPPGTKDNYFGAILSLCMKHELQQPVIEEISVTGEGSHKPEFTYRCKLGTNETYGVAATKKEAKRIASEEMLKKLEAQLEREDSTSCDSSSICSNEVVPNVLPLMNLPTVEEVLAEYRRLKKPYLQPVVDGLRYRKNFFMNLPAGDRRMAQQVLTNRSDVVSAKEMVDQTCKVLNLKYEIKPMKTPPNYLRFCLIDTKYDCVFIEHSNKLFSRIVEYFKTMLKMQNLAEKRERINEMNNNF
ncbi:uncharacterized protein LOC129572558 [Sitodiplosis mosellana]|uniref:uncharacterized protein LOC129572558 n=1 Tax=Sitodiplosis mosellana TaxID=263140 RepID=UPI002445316D|nr:uncharacterized protein LOC129572558 [Sitodiplosis mosellana]